MHCYMGAWVHAQCMAYSARVCMYVYYYYIYYYIYYLFIYYLLFIYYILYMIYMATGYWQTDK